MSLAFWCVGIHAGQGNLLSSVSEGVGFNWYEYTRIIDMVLSPDVGSALSLGECNIIQPLNKESHINSYAMDWWSLYSSNRPSGDCLIAEILPRLLSMKIYNCCNYFVAVWMMPWSKKTNYRHNTCRSELCMSFVGTWRRSRNALTTTLIVVRLSVMAFALVLLSSLKTF